MKLHVRQFDDKLGKMLKKISGEKALSKAVVSSCTEYLKLIKEHEKLQREFNALTEKHENFSAAYATKLEAEEILRKLLK